MTNALWLPPGAELIEIDAEAHAPFARQSYQRLARAVGLRPTKVWLGQAGAFLVDRDEEYLGEVSRRRVSCLIPASRDLRPAIFLAADELPTTPRFDRQGMGVVPCTHRYPDGAPVLSVDLDGMAACRALAYDARGHMPRELIEFLVRGG